MRMLLSLSTRNPRPLALAATTGSPQRSARSQRGARTRTTFLIAAAAGLASAAGVRAQCAVSFEPAVNYAAPDPFSVAIGDLNGDGQLDVVVTNLNTNNVSVLVGAGDGSLAGGRSCARTGAGGAGGRVAERADAG